MDKSKPTKVKKKLGRPIEWGPERVERERILLEQWFEKPSRHSLTEFAHSRGYVVDWLEDLSKKSEAFALSYKKSKQICADRISKGALNNKLNPTMAIFMLKCNHGWREVEKEEEKQQVIHVHLPEIETSKTFPVPHKEECKNTVLPRTKKLSSQKS